MRFRAGRWGKRACAFPRALSPGRAVWGQPETAEPIAGVGGHHLEEPDAQADPHDRDEVVVQPLLQAPRAALGGSEKSGRSFSCNQSSPCFPAPRRLGFLDWLLARTLQRLYLFFFYKFLLRPLSPASRCVISILGSSHLLSPHLSCMIRY